MKIHRLPRAPLAIALASVLLAQAATAADTLPADAAAAEGEAHAAKKEQAPESDPAQLGKVEVVGMPGIYGTRKTRTATKTETLLIDVPQSITVVNDQLIRDQRMQGMADVVRYVPGAQMAQGEGNRDTPILRGSSSTADMFMDGMRDDVQYFRDLYNIERVEALKGSNAMIFGRGGSGGVLNRVSKQADFNTVRGFELTWGANSRGRAVADWGEGLGEDFAFRINALTEETGSFRDDVDYSRRGFNPTLAWRPGEHTLLNVGYERFEDERTADRGIPSLNGRPVDVDPSTFFGDPERSESTADVDALTLFIEHEFSSGLSLRNRTRAADYSKFYQNVFPGSIFATGVQVSAYNASNDRENVFNQTELEWNVDTGGWRHTLLAGAEFDRQVSDNLRVTGFFPANNCTANGGATVTSTCVSLANPRYTGPITWAQSATDADNHSVARNAAVFLQDQVEFSPEWQAIVGLRYDRFEMDLHNNRNGADLSSSDGLLSPRVGLVYKPVPEASLYGSWSVAYQPRSGEQLSSLTLANAALDPEKFENLELGAKWQFTPELTATAAVYKLDRSNVAVVDPADSTRLVVLPGDSQRVQGVELGLTGDIGERWHVMGGYAWQKGEITRDIQTSAAASSKILEGTQLAQVPRHSFSLWNRVDLGQRWGVGLGIVARSKVYANISNAVTLPGYVRADAAVFYSLTDAVALQLNVENLFDVDYYANAHSDSNISPGSPRAYSLGLNFDF